MTYDNIIPRKVVGLLFTVMHWHEIKGYEYFSFLLLDLKWIIWIEWNKMQETALDEITYFFNMITKYSLFWFLRSFSIKFYWWSEEKYLIQWPFQHVMVWWSNLHTLLIKQFGENHPKKMFSLISELIMFHLVRGTRSLVLCVCFVDRFLSFCTFPFGHCVVCSSIYRFWLPPFGILRLFLYQLQEMYNVHVFIDVVND